jgi:hypothetical protein
VLPSQVRMLFATIAVWLVGLAAPAAIQQPVNQQAAVVAEFNKNVKSYMDVRQKAVSSFQPLKEDADPKTIADREKALGDAIRTVRAGSKAGDILSPAIARVFRRAIKEDFRRRSAHGKKVMLDEMPHFRPVLNQTYPSTWPLQTFPATLLAEFPKLPPELEYRFVSDALILRDVKANIVVDYVLDVM